MTRLEAAQGRFTTEEDTLTELLRETLGSTKALSQRPMKDLFSRLQGDASGSGSPFPFKSVGALTKALNQKRTALERALNIRIDLDNHHRGGGYHVEITQSPLSASPGNGGDGGDDSVVTPSGEERVIPKTKESTVVSPPKPPSPPSAAAVDDEVDCEA